MEQSWEIYMGLRRPPHWVCVCDYFIFYIINIYGYISYTFLIYSIYAYMFPRYVPCIFPCVFLNLWSQEKTSPYRKTTFLFLFFQILHLLYFSTHAIHVLSSLFNVQCQTSKTCRIALYPINSYIFLNTYCRNRQSLRAKITDFIEALHVSRA